MLFFEDIQPGAIVTGSTFTVDRDEMVEFARRWDPQPFHIDDEAGKAAFGGLIASGVFVLAVKIRLFHQSPESELAVIAGLGYDELRFYVPVRPGDTLRLHQEWLSKRESESKPDRGVAKCRLSLTNQDGVTVSSHVDTVLVRRRTPRSDARPPAPTGPAVT
jgi:acyl dehydratase